MSEDREPTSGFAMRPANRLLRPMRLLSLVLLAAVGFGLSGCGGGERPVDQWSRDGILVLSNSAEPQGLDPHTVTGFPEHQIIMALLEGLVAEHPSDSNQVLPGVAERWEPNEDKSVWTFHFREEARWSNGDPVTAGDFAYAYERILTPDLGAYYASMLYLLKGAEAFHKAETDDFATVGVEVVDDRTLRLHLVGPTPYFPKVLLHYTYFPVHPPTIAKFDAFSRTATGWTRPGNYVGNGAFTLAEWSVNEVVRVVPNPEYWDAETVTLNEIRFLPIENLEAEEIAFRAGQLHKTSGIPLNKRDLYRDRHPEITRFDPFLSVGYVGLNTGHAFLDEPLARRALAMATDRASIVSNLTKNGEPATAFVPAKIRAVTGYEPTAEIPYDPAQARELLAQAGYPGGDGAPDLRLVITNADSVRVMAEALQQMWRENLGLNVVVENMEWRVLLDTVNRMDFDMFILSWVADYVDPVTFLELWRTGDGNNRTGWGNEQFDALIAQSRVEPDAQQRLDLLAQAEDILLASNPMVPLVWSYRLYLLHPAVEGWEPKLTDNHPYKFIRLNPEARLSL